MQRYEHKQIGYLILGVSALVAVMFGYIYVQAERSPIIVLFSFFILFVLASFSSLTVTIDETHLRIRFGYGIFKKAWPLTDLHSVQAVKHHWYYGWGIRVWPWPYMWIYCVSGFDSVEIRTKKGRIFRIGTDESKKLEAALQELIG